MINVHMDCWEDEDAYAFAELGSISVEKFDLNWEFSVEVVMFGRVKMMDSKERFSLCAFNMLDWISWVNGMV